MDKMNSSDSQITEEDHRGDGSVNRSQEIPQSIRKKLQESPDINFCKNQEVENIKNSRRQLRPDVSGFNQKPLPTSRINPRIGNINQTKEIENDFIK